MARRRRSPLKRALRAMAPHRVLWRALSGPEVMSAVRSKTATRTVKVTAATRQRDVQRATKTAAKKTPAKKTAAKRTDPYAVALGIPARNSAVAAKQAKAAQPAKKSTTGRTRKTTATTVVPVRNPDGTFNGSQAVPTFDAAAQDANRRAWTGYVDPALLPRSPRTRKRPTGY